MSDGLRHLPLREATLQLWMADGFIASVSRDGRYLMIDGLVGQQEQADAMLLINQVAAQIKCYSMQQLQSKAASSPRETNVDMAFLASALEQTATQHQPQLRS